MARERKSPQQKKELEYTKDHFTFGYRSSRKFPRVWKRKKARTNRKTRRKHQEIIGNIKSGTAASELEFTAGDLTTARLEKVGADQRLYKTGTVTVGEKVKRNLERRREVAEQRAQEREINDRLAESAVNMISSLQGKELHDLVRRADLLCNEQDSEELSRVYASKDAIDHAVLFLYRLRASTSLAAAIDRSPRLAEKLKAWLEKANRILEKDKRARDQKIKEKGVARQRLKEWGKRSKINKGES